MPLAASGHFQRTHSASQQIRIDGDRHAHTKPGRQIDLQQAPAIERVRHLLVREHAQVDKLPLGIVPLGAPGRASLRAAPLLAAPAERSRPRPVDPVEQMDTSKNWAIWHALVLAAIAGAMVSADCPLSGSFCDFAKR